MEIIDFKATRLKNNAHLEFHLEVKKMVEQNGADKLNIVEIFKTYEDLLKKEVEGLDIIRQSELTKSLAKLDEERDRIFAGLFANVKSLTKHFDNAIVENAERLMPVFKNFGNVAILSYNEETSAIDRLTNELLGEYIEPVKAIGVEAWVIKLRSENEAFRSMMLQRNEATAVKEPIHMRTLRKEIDSVYQAMIKRINASALLMGDENYADFIANLNNRIDYYKVYNM